MNVPTDTNSPKTEDIKEILAYSLNMELPFSSTNKHKTLARCEMKDGSSLELWLTTQQMFALTGNDKFNQSTQATTVK